METPDRATRIKAITDKLEEIGDGDLYELTSKLPDTLVKDGSVAVALYTSYNKTRDDGTREISLKFGWRVDGIDRDGPPTEDQRIILAHRLVAGAVMVLSGRGWPDGVA